MAVWFVVLCAYLTFGVSCCVALALAMSPRVWHNDRELMLLTAACVACILAWPLVLIVGIAMQSEYVTELFVNTKDGA